MSDTPSDVELEEKAALIAQYVARDLVEIGLSDIHCNFTVTPTPDGPVINVSHNGTEEDGVIVTNLFRTLLTEQGWPGF